MITHLHASQSDNLNKFTTHLTIDYILHAVLYIQWLYMMSSN